VDKVDEVEIVEQLIEIEYIGFIIIVYCVQEKKWKYSLINYDIF